MFILFGNFWSFLLVLSGIVDVVIGLLVLFDVIQVVEHSFLAAIFCFVVGAIYFSGGVIIALVKMRKKKS